MFITITKYLVPAAFIVLTACTMRDHHHITAGGQLNQVCENLKQEILMDSIRNVPEEGGMNPATQARMYKAYDKNDCDKVLKQKALIRAHSQRVDITK